MHAPTRRVLRGDVPYAVCRAQLWRVFWAVRNRMGMHSCDVHSMLSGDAVLYDVDVASAHYAHARLHVPPSHGGRLAQPGGAGTSNPAFHGLRPSFATSSLDGLLRSRAAIQPVQWRSCASAVRHARCFPASWQPVPSARPSTWRRFWCARSCSVDEWATNIAHGACTCDVATLANVCRFDRAAHALVGRCGDGHEQDCSATKTFFDKAGRAHHSSAASRCPS